MRRKFIIVTGGVISGLGKGIVAASIGRLLSSQYKVVSIKCDGYLNVDPGTMNPVEHGEVFVLDDGGEVDLDFGHYERFLNINCKFNWNLTSGKIFQGLVEKERKGDFLGKTVQVIPHVTGEIRERWMTIAKKEDADIILIEIGGTVGDLENLWFLEAVRELIRELPQEDSILVHVGLVPVVDAQGQQKTKPMQQSVLFLRERGLFPQVIVGRSDLPLVKKTKQKIHWLLNVPEKNVISDPSCMSVYELPLIFEQEGLRDVLSRHLRIRIGRNLRHWKKLVRNIVKPVGEITIAVCGKYTELADSYISIEEALRHAGAHYGCKVNIVWIETTAIEQKKKTVSEILEGVHGVIVPGGFGSRGIEGKIEVIRHVREQNIPFLGICLGMQLAVIEFSRNVCKLDNAHSTEVRKTEHPVIDLLPEQREVYKKGGTMRLGGQDVFIKKGTKAYKLFGSKKIRRRFRHRYEVNPDYIERLEESGLVFSGNAGDKQIMQVMELPDLDYFMAAQFHPELTSRLERPSPLFLGLVKNVLKRKNK